MCAMHALSARSACFSLVVIVRPRGLCDRLCCVCTRDGEGRLRGSFDRERLRLNRPPLLSFRYRGLERLRLLRESAERDRSLFPRADIRPGLDGQDGERRPLKGPPPLRCCNRFMLFFWEY